jgi:hypothetical protein
MEMVHGRKIAIWDMHLLEQPLESAANKACRVWAAV